MATEHNCSVASRIAAANLLTEPSIDVVIPPTTLFDLLIPSVYPPLPLSQILAFFAVTGFTSGHVQQGGALKSKLTRRVKLARSSKRKKTCKSLRD